MLDDYKDKQPIAYKILLNTIKKNKNFHAYLVETNENSEGLSIALAFAKALLCPKKQVSYSNCGDCKQCQTIDDGNSLEIKIISADGMWIKKDQITDLQQEFSRKAVIGNKKIYIINEVEKLNLSSANSILKFLEEPEENIVAILLTNNIYQVLETIVSRCLVIPLKKEKTNLSLLTTSPLDEILNKNIIDDKKSVNNSNKYDIISVVLNFVIYYEEKGITTIAHIPLLLENFIDNKEDVELILDLMLFAYKDALNLLCTNSVKYYIDFEDKIKKISTLTTIEKICDKIKIIINTKNLLKINANVSLLLDNLIIKMEGGR